MSWIYLIIAGVIEIFWAMCMKQSEGFSKLWPSIGVLVLGGLSIGFLTLALRDLPMGTAYAVWTGIGASGTAIVGILWLKDPASAARIVCIAMIIAGVIGLKITAADSH